MKRAKKPPTVADIAAILGDDEVAWAMIVMIATELAYRNRASKRRKGAAS